MPIPKNIMLKSILRILSTRVKLKSPLDACRLIRRVINEAFAQHKELEYSGRLAQLFGVWLKAWELEKTSEHEKRIQALEERLGKHEKVEDA
jgi:hypothetical protein